MIILLQDPGTIVRKHSQMLKIERSGHMQEIAIKNVESVVVQSRVHITHSALLLCARHGIPIIYLQKHKPVASFQPFAYHGFVQTRRAQFAAYSTVKGLQLVYGIIEGAITNKRMMIQYYARNRRQSHPKTAKKLMQIASQIPPLLKELGQLINQIQKQYRDRFPGKNATDYPYQESHIGDRREQIMAIEGQAAHHYFSALMLILPSQLKFTERNRRPPRDPVNAALSFGYSLLEKEILTGIITAGLEPYAGFLHSDRSGRPSLVYDLIEEFRQPIVDRLVIRLFQHKLLQTKDFQPESAGTGVRFTESALQKFLGEFYYMIRKDGITDKNYYFSYQRCILRQARRVVRFLTQQSQEYTPFQFQW
jgi:CRISP-associated protein Cas1